MEEMGNTGNRFQEDSQEETPQHRNRPSPQPGARSNVVYHVMVNRGNIGTSEIHREEIIPEQQQSIQDNNCSEEETSSSEDVEYGDMENEQLVTLQILSRLLGIGSNLRQRSVHIAYCQR